MPLLPTENERSLLPSLPSAQRQEDYNGPDVRMHEAVAWAKNRKLKVDAAVRARKARAAAAAAHAAATEASWLGPTDTNSQPHRHDALPKLPRLAAPKQLGPETETPREVSAWQAKSEPQKQSLSPRMKDHSSKLQQYALGFQNPSALPSRTATPRRSLVNVVLEPLRAQTDTDTFSTNQEEDDSSFTETTSAVSSAGSQPVYADNDPRRRQSWDFTSGPGIAEAIRRAAEKKNPSAKKKRHSNSQNASVLGSNNALEEQALPQGDNATPPPDSCAQTYGVPNRMKTSILPEAQISDTFSPTESQSKGVPLDQRLSEVSVQCALTEQQVKDKHSKDIMESNMSAVEPATESSTFSEPKASSSMSSCPRLPDIGKPNPRPDENQSGNGLEVKRAGSAGTESTPSRPTQMKEAVRKDSTKMENHEAANCSSSGLPQAKKSALQATEDIRRRREERRLKQDVQRKKRAEEVRAHGDDEGYVPRELIRKFREKLSSGEIEYDQAAENPGSRLLVCIRKRPINQKELAAKCYDIITPVNDTCLVCHEPKVRLDMTQELENHDFLFDRVFGEKNTSEDVYNCSIGSLISNVRCGGSLTVFAYGQTGSGKSFTMSHLYQEALKDLLKFQDGKEKAPLFLSYYELYKNKVLDLLQSRKEVHMMENSEGAVQIVGLKETEISTYEQAMDIVRKGQEIRHTSANSEHSDSSRSHSVLKFSVRSDKGKLLGTLSMVDLAGSERASDMQSDDKATRQEGAEINKSLLALKECIRAMDAGASHVPFRGSKLTQVLRDSFTGSKAKTVMIATVSPSSKHANHSINTLRYAVRLKETM